MPDCKLTHSITKLKNRKWTPVVQPTYATNITPTDLQSRTPSPSAINAAMLVRKNKLSKWGFCYNTRVWIQKKLVQTLNLHTGVCILEDKIVIECRFGISGCGAPNIGWRVPSTADSDLIRSLICWLIIWRLGWSKCVFILSIPLAPGPL